MNVLVVTPAPRGLLVGNRTTAARYRRILSSIGARVHIDVAYESQDCDVLIALHARKSYDSIARFRREKPTAPLIVVLTGTDLYQDLPHCDLARQSLEWADRIVALQPLAARELAPHLVRKLRAIIQSARPALRRAPVKKEWRVSVVCNLRAVKDPLRAAEASRMLPPDSAIKVICMGRALETEYEKAALQEMAINPRFCWKGEAPHQYVSVMLSGSRLMAQTSILEGGANVVSEAIANEVPIVCSRIPGNLGILGEDYPGAFEPGDTQGLADLMYRAEQDAAFYGQMKDWCLGLKPLVSPERESADWQKLLHELGF
jgi:putative glycosyltransferase (TIGR04348 family)